MPTDDAMLKDVVKKLVAENPDKAAYMFDVAGRNTKAPFDHTLTEEEVEARLSHAEAYPKFACEPADEEGNPLPLPPIPDFHEEAVTMFNAVGTGFGTVTTYSIMNAIKHFAASTEGLAKVRFWGMVQGTEKDYFVAEGQMSAGGDPDPEDEAFEPLGTGANTFAYWVCNDVSNPVWTKLPEVYPQHLRDARQLKKLFTGNLDAKVVSYPWFSGEERHLLRAVISRITSDTVLNVKGYLVTDEDGNTAENEEFVYPEIDEMLGASSWVHCTPYLLGNGRTTYMDVDGDDETKAAEYAALQEAKALDPEQPLLRELDTGSWSFRKYRNKVVVARSQKWPGAIACYKQGVFSNVYVGYGHERSVGLFFPVAPPPVLDEPADQPEAPEPQPVDGPPAPPAEEGEGEAAEGE